MKHTEAFCAMAQRNKALVVQVILVCSIKSLLVLVFSSSFVDSKTNIEYYQTYPLT